MSVTSPVAAVSPIPEAPAASIDITAPSTFTPTLPYISIVPAVAFSLIASVPVPSDLRINEASCAPA